MVRRVEQGGRIASALRAARENLGLSIEQAASNAGIPLRYARLLEGESGPGIGISDSLYLIPFFRRYANCLGLKTEDLLADFLAELQETPGATGSQARPSYHSPLALLWKPAAVAAAIVLAVVLVNRRAPERPVFDDEQSVEVSPQGETARAEAGADLRPPAPEAADVPQTAGVGGPAPSPAADQAAPAWIEGHAAAAARAGTEALAPSEPAPRPDLAFATPEPGQGGSARELRIVATEETWLALAVDDEPVKSVLLQPGESRTWTARAMFTLTLGNAGGVTVVLDGRTLPSLGKSGQVVRNLRLPQGTPSPPREG
jgi:cytoskeletal protein RodZ